ncbi:hypothetical protein ACHAWF_003632 [Thalassiosira exigua]
MKEGEEATTPPTEEDPGPGDRIEGRCDICTKPDGERGHNLQRCRECGVLVQLSSVATKRFVVRRPRLRRRRRRRRGVPFAFRPDVGSSVGRDSSVPLTPPLFVFFAAHSELCYGMVPTSTKDEAFVCHACRAVGRDVEANVPSRVGGPTLRDLLADLDSAKSFLDFLGEGGGGNDVNGHGGRRRARALGKAEFCAAAGEFRSRRPAGEGGEGAEGERDDDGESASRKRRAQAIYDRHLARDAVGKVEASPEVLTGIEAEIYGGGGEEVSTKAFDAVRQEALRSLEGTDLLRKFAKSSHYGVHLARRRKAVRQETRPTECALCSVRSGTHALHPLYDFDGGEGRQLLLPASGAGFKRREPRLAWVHTLCAMAICSGGRTGGLVYGCDDEGKYETHEYDDGEEEGRDRKVIDSDDDEEEGESDGEGGERSAEDEQADFTKCEGVFLPLMDRLRGTIEGAKDADAALACVDAMIEDAELLTPPFVREYPIGPLVKQVRRAFEGEHPRVKKRCKELTAEMKRVFNEKEEGVPDGFKPVKNLGLPDSGGRPAQNGASKGGDGGSAAKNDEPKYEIGTDIVKEFRDRSYAGKITSYSEGQYHIQYEDGDEEDLDEDVVADLLLKPTAWFCMLPSNDSHLQIRRQLKCRICKKQDDKGGSLRIPVQCAALDCDELGEFKGFHKKLSKKKRKRTEKGEADHSGCTEAMHVGCARWGNDYVGVMDKRHLRMCYYFPGRPPTYTGEDGYKDPQVMCFCRIHARDVTIGLDRERKEREGGRPYKHLKSAEVGEDSFSDVSVEHKPAIAIARKKKKQIMEDSEEEDD